MIEYTSKNITLWSRMGSCGAFGIAANELPRIDEKTIILTSDLCFFSGLNRFKASYPDRLINCGIAEQNMIGIAGGLAKEGFNPFATTYASFVLRCADQLKVNMSYMKLPIKLIGLTSGLSVGILGATHICIEDLAIIRTIPNITILSPADCTETIKATIAAARMTTPVYIRLTGTMNNPIVYKGDYEFNIGKAIQLRDGNDISIIATGSMVHNSLKAAESLSMNGVEAAVLNMHTIKPLDIESIRNASKAKLVVTVEEHSCFGGLGGAVAEVLSAGYATELLRIGIDDFYPQASDYGCMVDASGLTAQKIAEKILQKLP